MPAVSTGSGPKRCDEPRGDPLREHRDGERPGQERGAGLQRAVVADVLEVERAEEERRVHARDEEAPDEARVDQAAQAEDAQRHDRVLDARLEREERRHQHRGERADAEHRGRDPAVVGRPGRSRRCALISEAVTSSEPSQSTPCPKPSPLSARISARPSTNVATPIGRLTKKTQCQLSAWVSSAAGEQAERAAGDRDEHVRAHRAGALGGLGELGDDDREDHRRLGGGADALQEAGADQHALGSGRGRTAATRP